MWEASSQRLSGKQQEGGLLTPTETDANFEPESELENSGVVGEEDQAKSQMLDCLWFCSHKWGEPVTERDWVQRAGLAVNCAGVFTLAPVFRKGCGAVQGATRTDSHPLENA